MNNTNESGRSMVEMLGVLAIIGVLSVMGIAGYTQAMRKYRINEAINEISMCSITCQANFNGVTNDCLNTTDVVGTSCDGNNGSVTVTIGGTITEAELAKAIPSSIGTLSGGTYTPAAS